MKVLKIIGIVLLVIFVLYFGYALVAPTSMHFQKSIKIEKPAEMVFNEVVAFEKWKKWSPWQLADTNMKIEYSDQKGLGAVIEWDSEDQGLGRQEIVELTEFSLIKTKFNFEGMPGDHYARFLFEPEAEGTKVTWTMESAEVNLLFRPLTAMAQGMVENNYVLGLTTLKGLLEAMEDSPKRYRAYNIQEIEMSDRTYWMKMDTVEFAGIKQFYMDNLYAVFNACKEAGMKMQTRPSGLYFSWDPENGKTCLAAGVGVTNSELTAEGFESLSLDGKALMIEHRGAYEASATAHEAIAEYMLEKELKYRSPVLEEFITDPGTEPDTSKWVTHIYYLLDEGGETAE